LEGGSRGGEWSWVVGGLIAIWGRGRANVVAPAGTRLETVAGTSGRRCATPKTTAWRITM
jgi:hypothetical protein